ncbi:hypothetical protein [Pseudomonas eucalypticola]|nr:hypothetical protein [Pseudomonas eucalypticola]
MPYRHRSAPVGADGSRLQEYVDAHLACPLSIKSLAMLVDLSP